MDRVWSSTRLVVLSRPGELAGFLAVGGGQLAEQVAHVVAHCLVGEDESPCDRTVAEAEGKQVEDLQLPVGEVGKGGAASSRSRWLDDPGQDVSGDTAAEDDLAMADRVQRAGDLRTVSALDQVSPGWGSLRLRPELVQANAAANQLAARVRGAEGQPVVAIGNHASLTGRGSGNWLVLHVAASPPAPDEP